MTEHGAHPVLRISQGLTAFNSLIGSAVAWLTLLMVLVTTYVVVLRYGFGKGSIAMQESVTYMHCAVFMLGSAMTLARGGHVRVDIFYQHWGARRKALVDLLGALFLLLPFATFLVLSSTGYVSQSWRIGEGSTEPDGLHLVYLLKSMIPVAGVMLGLQAVADILRNALLLAGFGVSSDAPMPTEEII